jgi:hypothetical protein
MMSNGYNGWANYETWRTNMELFDGTTPEDMGVIVMDADRREDDVNALANALEALAYDVVEEQAKGWALDLAQSFLARVDWEEIAEHMIEDAITELV